MILRFNGEKPASKRRKRKRRKEIIHEIIVINNFTMICVLVEGILLITHHIQGQNWLNISFKNSCKQQF